MKDITEFPFQELYACTKDVLAKQKNKNLKVSDGEVTLAASPFLSAHNVPAKYNVLMPQILRYFSKMHLIKTPENKIDGKASLVSLYNNCEDKNWFIGMMVYLNSLNRSKILSTSSTRPESTIYSCYTPIIMMAHKQLADVSYNSWDVDNLDGVVPKALLALMCWKELPIEYTDDYWLDTYGFTSSQILEYRTESLKNKSPQTAYMFGAIEGRPPISRMPLGIRHMACQTWVCHVDNRNEYMILDPVDWDRMPEPLVDGELFGTTIKSEEKKLLNNDDLPWDI